MRPLAALAVLLFAASPLRALEPYGTEWRAIELEDYRLIYPEALEELAQRTAELLLATRHPVSEEWDKPAGHLPLVLHPHSVQSNAYVAPVPFKSEWVTAPPADPIFGATDWIRLLATHEFRHVDQFESLRTGWSFGRFLQFLYGPIGLALHSVVTWPRWFAEGDAVLAETLLTDGGRGRLPSFYEPLQAAMLEGASWDLLDIHYGSYRRYVPGPYEMGYFLAARIRSQTSEKKWRLMLNRARAGFPRRFYMTGLYHSLRAHTKRDVSGWVRSTLKDLGKRFDAANALTPSARASWLIPERPSPTNYRYPQPLSDGRLLALKTSHEDSPALVALDARGEEQIVSRPDLPSSGLRFHARGMQAVLAQEQEHPRWEDVSGSDLYLLDIQGGHLRRLTRGGRYFHPWLDEGGRQVAAAWIPGDGKPGWIAVIDTATGLEKGRYTAPPGCLVLSPVFLGDGLAAILRDRRGWHGVVRWDDLSKTWKELLPLEKEVLADLWADGGRLYLMSPRDGASEIYTLDPAHPTLKRLTVSRSGSVHPAVSRGTLYFSERDGLGLRPASAKLDQPAPPEPAAPRLVDVFTRLLPEAEEGKAEIDAIATSLSPTSHPSRAYSPWEHSVGLIGWNAFGLLLTTTPEVSILSMDAMGTLLFEATLGADSEHSTAWGAFSGQYLQSCLPVDLGVEAGTFVSRESGLPDDVFEAQHVEAGLTLPLRWHSQGWTHQFQARIGGYYRHLGAHSLSSTSEAGLTTFGGEEAALAAYFLKDGGAKHLQAPWGLRLEGAGVHADAVGERPGWSWAHSSLAGLYLPGLFRHHGLLAEGAYSRQAGARYAYGPFGRFATGYSRVAHPELWTAATHYVFPLGYPDWRLKYPGLLLRQVFARLFYEHTWGSGPSDSTYRSLGGLCYFDMGMAYNDFIQPTIGLGATYRIDDRVTLVTLDLRSSF